MDAIKAIDDLESCAYMTDEDLFQSDMDDRKIMEAADMAREEIARLRAELEAAKVDAEHYRWLREQCNRKESVGTFIAMNRWGFEWDAAIDAARSE